MVKPREGKDRMTRRMTSSVTVAIRCRCIGSNVRFLVCVVTRKKPHSCPPRKGEKQYRPHSPHSTEGTNENIIYQDHCCWRSQHSDAAAAGHTHTYARLTGAPRAGAHAPHSVSGVPCIWWQNPWTGFVVAPRCAAGARSRTTDVL